MFKRMATFCIALLLTTCNVTSTPTLAPVTLTPAAEASVTPTPPPPACTVGDQLPYVYHPARLQVIQSCVRILARIEAMKNEADGDVHIFARLNDTDAQQYLNAGNAHEKGDLVVEPVCVNTPTQADAIQPCSQDPDPLTIDQLPKVGDCVWLEGQLIEDTQHFSWREIHPLGRFQPGQGCPDARILTADDFLDPGD
jgi:hypothetical protein